MKERKVVSRIHPAKVTEGAGVRLARCFGNNDIPRFDPFLLLDNFHSSDPRDYTAGFPWHPHRGIETVTYMLKGAVEHGDSLGNRGLIHDGELQWMTAGSGIVHQEMPQIPPDKHLWGLQLWINLPASKKMTAPRYRDITSAAIPSVNFSRGATIKVISGQLEETAGPVADLMVDIFYYDITLAGNSRLKLPVHERYNSFAFILEGEVSIGGTRCIAETGVHLSGGSLFTAENIGTVSRFILAGGTPLKEPVAWGGPIVMNTREELETAFDELNKGTFIK